MKLQTIHDGRVLATSDRSIYIESAAGSGMTRIGRLPEPPSAGVGYRLKTTAPYRSIVTAVTGRFPAVNVWSIDETTLLASADRWVFRSADSGRNWTVIRTLPASSPPMGVLPSAVCVTDDAVYLGEYPLDEDATPRVLVSTDRGKTWTTATTLPDVRHIHAVQADPYTGDIWVTTGDTDDDCTIGRLRDGTIDIVGGGSQSWRAVELAFTPAAVLWGVDSVYAERKPIRKLPRAQFDDESPAPETVHTVSSSVYYAETVSVDGELWTLFSTAMEAGADSTGPDTQTVHSDGATVVAASSASGFTDWYELASYRKRTLPGDRWNPRGRVPTANAYVFLASDPTRGVFINPYNTGHDDGTVRPIPPRAFAAHS